MLPGEQMQMYVKNRLSSTLFDIHNQAVAMITHTMVSGDLPRFQH